MVAFPNPRIFPLFVSLSPSALFALNTRSCPLVLPIKSLAQMEFPERVHAFDEPADAAQRAFPEASEVRTYPFEAPERILSHWKVPVPTTSSLEVGEGVQIPIFPVERFVPVPSRFVQNIRFQILS
jgi:hypothetical protein